MRGDWVRWDPHERSVFDMFMRIKRVGRSRSKTLEAGEGTWLIMTPRQDAPRAAKTDDLAMRECISPAGGYAMRIRPPARIVSNMRMAKHALRR